MISSLVIGFILLYEVKNMILAITKSTKGILKSTFNQGNDPLPQMGPINMAKLATNLLTACPNPCTSSDNNFENKAKEMSSRIGILAKSRTVPMENDQIFDRSLG